MYECMMKRKTQERKKSKVEKKQITEKSPRPEGLGLVSTNRIGLSLNLRERNRGMKLNSDESEGERAKQMWCFLYFLLQ